METQRQAGPGLQLRDQHAARRQGAGQGVRRRGRRARCTRSSAARRSRASRRPLASGEPLLVGCTQEAPLFEETRAEFGPETAVGYTNIRERAGWAEEGRTALPKIAALLAEATLDVPPTPTVTMRSAGACLVYGRDEAAIEAAKQLAPRLSVTVILTAAEGRHPAAADRRADLRRHDRARLAAISARSS